jgi:hypothetical protein
LDEAQAWPWLVSAKPSHRKALLASDLHPSACFCRNFFVVQARLGTKLASASFD